MEFIFRFLRLRLAVRRDSILFGQIAQIVTRFGFGQFLFGFRYDATQVAQPITFLFGWRGRIR